MNTMFKLENVNTGWITTAKENGDNFERFIRGLEELELKVTRFEAGCMKLGDLPEKTQEEVKSILRAFNECTVTYERGGFNASTGCMICASYPSDHFVCGTYKQTEVYTLEQRRQNFIEEFGYAPAYMN